MAEGESANQRAWLMLAAGDDREHAGNDGYADDPSSTYVWDTTVANHGRPKPGDRLVLWDKSALLGISTIDHIHRENAVKVIRRCPRCSRTNVKERKLSKPRFRCARQGCHFETDSPVEETKSVTRYSSFHEAAWVELVGELDATQLRATCLQPRAQHSIRELNWNRLLRQLNLNSREIVERLSKANTSPNEAEGKSGHTNRTVRARLGQGKFRADLLKKFGNMCVFTGIQPAETLEAAHLYSYAAKGRHEDGGGLLIRRDLHRLFDLGLLTATPRTQLMNLSPPLQEYPSYQKLHGHPLAMSPGVKESRWLRRHYELHRPSG